MNQIIENLTFGEYLALPGQSASSLKPCLASPAAYKFSLDHPTTATTAMEYGTLAHYALLEPDLLPILCNVATPVHVSERER